MSFRASHCFLRPQVSLAVLSTLLFSSLSLAQETPAAEETKAEAKKEDSKGSEQVTVRGTRVISEDMYVQQSSSAGNKDDSMLKDTPQSVSVVSQAQIRDQGAQSVQQATRYSAGVTSEVFGTDIRGDYISIRGTQQVSQFRDGMQTIFSPNVTQARFPLFGAEKIEILRGPSSMLYGQSTIGGLVNVISKIPRAEEKGEARLELGSFNRTQASFDVMGAVSEDKTWSYRLVSQVRDSDTFVEHATDDSVYFAPSLRWQPSRDASVTLLLNYQRDDGIPTAQFVPIGNSLRNEGLGKIRRETYLGEPGFNEQVVEQRSISILYDQAFNDVFSYHQNVRFMDTKTSYQDIFPSGTVDPLTGLLPRTSYVYKSASQSAKIDGHVRAVLDNSLAPTTLMLGVDYQTGEIDANSGFNSQSSINAYNPVYGNYINPALSEVPKYKQWQTGVYLQADVDVTESTKLILGVRQDRAKTEGSSFDKTDDSATTSRAAVIQEVAPNTNVYASYAESFTPNQGIDKNKEAYKPRKGRQAELGAKYQLQSLFAGLSYFQTTESNRLQDDPSSTLWSDMLAEGKTKINGVELEAAYDVAFGISGNASFSWLKTEVTGSPVSVDEGRRLAGTPEQMGSAWVNYNFGQEVLKGLKTGVGARYIGKTWDGADANETASYTLYDAVVSYKRSQWELALNGNNLADKIYLTSCRTQGDCFYGQSRTLTMTTAYHF